MTIINYSKEEKINLLKSINRDNLNVNIQYNGSVCGTSMNYKAFKIKTPKELLQKATESFDIKADNIKELKIYENPEIEVDGELIRIFLGTLELNEGEALEDYIDFRADYCCETDEEFDTLIKMLKGEQVCKY